MAMKVKKHLDFLRVLFFKFSYIVENARYLRKHFLFFRMLIDIPISVEIVTQNSSSVISELNSINIDHGNHYPMDFFGEFHFINLF